MRHVKVHAYLPYHGQALALKTLPGSFKKKVNTVRHESAHRRLAVLLKRELFQRNLSMKLHTKLQQELSFVFDIGFR